VPKGEGEPSAYDPMVDATMRGGQALPVQIFRGWQAVPLRAEMNTADYSEDALVEKPAIELFRKLGWKAANCFHEFDYGQSPLGRESKGEVVLVQRLRPALEKLNSDLPSETISLAIEELTVSGQALCEKGAELNLSSGFQAEDEFQAGPSLVHGADLNIDQPMFQTHLADDILVQIRRELRGSFWPGNPE